MTIISGSLQAGLGYAGAQAQADAAKYAAEIQYKIYEQQREDLLPSLRIQQKREQYALDRFEDLNWATLLGPGEFEESEDCMSEWKEYILEI